MQSRSSLWRYGVPGVNSGRSFTVRSDRAWLVLLRWPFATEKLKLRIQFNEKPGGYWSTSNAGLQTIINFGINAGKITKEEAEKWVKRFYKQQTSHQTRSLVPGIRRTHSQVPRYINTAIKTAVMHDTGNVSDSDSDEEF